MIYVEYPIQNFSTVEKGSAMFRVLGDQRLSCRLRIIPTAKKELPKFKVTTERQESTETVRGRETPEGHIEYELFGDRAVIVQWEAEESESRARKNGRNGQKGRKK
jgi:hypothetical protein